MQNNEISANRKRSFERSSKSFDKIFQSPFIN